MLVDSDVSVNFGGCSGIRCETISQDVGTAATARHAVQSVLRVRITLSSIPLCTLPQTERVGGSGDY
jgi:hypothetical protein